MAVAPEPRVLIGYPGTHANVLLGLKATVGLDANRPKFALVVNRILIVPITPNVVQIELADVDKGSNPREPCV
jgi:hypothetical protein